ncbi:MAG: GMP reductase, partial [Gammaproteobacteria bacterium]|nr:GMP reductase [Gammaproteobacteria bacterium]
CRSAEGRDILVDCRGEIKNTIQDLLGGIRSTCTYAGSKKLKWLSKCTTFVKTGQQFNAIFGD